MDRWYSFWSIFYDSITLYKDYIIYSILHYVRYSSPTNKVPTLIVKIYFRRKNIFPFT